MRKDREAKKARREKALENLRMQRDAWKAAKKPEEIRSLVSDRYAKMHGEIKDFEVVRKMKLDNCEAMIAILKERV